MLLTGVNINVGINRTSCSQMLRGSNYDYSMPRCYDMEKPKEDVDMPSTPKESSLLYTYSDYLTWSEDERWELINGVPYNMTPAPTPKHQEVLGELFLLLANWLKKTKCKVYMAPFDVRLVESETVDSLIDKVVQPDITVVCDPEKIDERGCAGIPDMIIEILSPSTFKKDLGIKLALYESSGVQEYWVVHPTDETVMVFKLQNNQYGKPTVYSVPDVVPVGLFGDLAIQLESVFHNTSI